MMNALRLFPHRAGFQSTLPTEHSTRTEVFPPALRCAPAGAVQRLCFWLFAPAPHDIAPPRSRLPAVRGDFLRCLDDVQHDDGWRLQQRIKLAQSLRDLWHLRADVYRLVAVAHSQSQAEARIAELNRHFPTRAPKSQFGPL